MRLQRELMRRLMLSRLLSKQAVHHERYLTLGTKAATQRVITKNQDDV